MERVLTISDGAIRDVIAGELEEMRGDAIVRHRMAIMFARDCARRKLIAVLLAAVDQDSRERLRALVTGWEDAEARAAGHEVLDHAWLPKAPQTGSCEPSAASREPSKEASS